MKKIILLLLLLPFYCLAQIPAYYNSINFSQPANTIKTQLSQLITTTHTHELIYTPEVWTALKQTDIDPANPNNVLLIYGYNDTDSSPNNDRSRSKDASCHTSSCNGLWVREHVFPRSLGNPNLDFEGPGSDAHHLRAIDSNMNNDRGNRKYAAGSGNSAMLAGSLFYPGDEWKGDVARMIMYMYLRYQSQCLPVAVGAGSTSYSPMGDMPNIFLEWNAQDPVNAYEINRNNVLQNMQGNRNPFIDNPYLATMIWNGPAAQNTWTTLGLQEVAQQALYVYPTLTKGIVYVMNSTEPQHTYTVYNSLGQQVKASISDNTIDLSGNARGIYFLNIEEAAAHKTFRVVLQ